MREFTFSESKNVLFMHFPSRNEIDCPWLLTLSSRSRRTSKKKDSAEEIFAAGKSERGWRRGRSSVRKKVENENLWSTLNYNLLWLRFFRFAFPSSRFFFQMNFSLPRPPPREKQYISLYSALVVQFFLIITHSRALLVKTFLPLFLLEFSLAIGEKKSSFRERRKQFRRCQTFGQQQREPNKEEHIMVLR